MVSLFTWGDISIVAKDRKHARELLLDEEHGNLAESIFAKDVIEGPYPHNEQLDGMFSMDDEGECVYADPQPTVKEYIEMFCQRQDFGVIHCYDG